jgi:hypothetical protein
MYQLPGLAAKSTLYEFTDSYKRPFAMLHVPTTSHFTVIFSTEPDGASWSTRSRSTPGSRTGEAGSPAWRRGRPGRRGRDGGDRPGLRVPAPQRGRHEHRPGRAGICPGDSARSRGHLPRGIGHGPGLGVPDLQCLPAGRVQEAHAGRCCPRPCLPDPGSVGPAAVHRCRYRPADVGAGTLRGRPGRLRPARCADH